MVFCAVCIMARFISASRMSVVEMPNSRSMPSTPRNSLLNENPESIISAYLPTTERLVWRTRPPSCMRSMVSSGAKSSATCSEAVTTVRRLSGWMFRAKAWMVVPDASTMESLGVISLAASMPMSRFSSMLSFSFSVTVRLLVKGFMRMALPWLR